MARVTLDLNDEVRKRLDEIKQKSGAASITEVIRRAISVYEAALDEEIDGGKVMLEASDGNNRRQILVR